MPRKDQLRNRRKLIEAARLTFIDSGTGASLEEVAVRAEVGISTLYRHFPTRDDLVEAVLSDLITGIRDDASRLGEIEDPRAAFRAALTEICDLDSAELDVFARLAGTSPRTEAYARSLVIEVIQPTVERLDRVEGLREGITTEDIVTFIRMVESTPCEPRQRRTALEVLLDGLIT